MVIIFVLCVDARFLRTYIKIYGKCLIVPNICFFMYEQCEEMVESTPKNTNFNTPSTNAHLNKRFILLERLFSPKSMQYSEENQNIFRTF